MTLSAEESHYVSRVCRVRPGGRLSVTDGRGGLAQVEVRSAGHAVQVVCESVEWGARPPEAWLLCGAPDAQRADWLVEKIAELGLSILQPVDCERAAWRRSSSRAERWRRIAVAALRQSQRRFLLEVRTPLSIAEAIETIPTGIQRWMADIEGRPAGDATPAANQPVVGIVGPSTGLSPKERTSLVALGFSPICLSGARLRTETAALAWACWWAAGQIRSTSAGLPRGSGA